MNRLHFTLCIRAIVLAALMVACAPGGQAVQTTSVSDTATASQTPSIAASTELPATPTETPQLATATEEPTATTEPSQTTVPATATVEAPTATSIIPAATLDPTSEASPVAGTLLCDPDNEFSLHLPEGWNALGPTTITNYDEEDVAALGQGQEGVFPAGGLKSDIFVDAIAPGTFDTTIAEWIEQERLPFGPGTAPLTVTEPQPYELAAYQGVTYTVEPDGQNHVPVMVIALQVRAEKVIRVSLMPANSSSLDQGLSLLSTLRDGECEG